MSARAGIVSRLMMWRAACLLICGSAVALRADEGYWLFSDPSTQAIADKYHFAPDAAWLDHLRGAVLKIGGATGSFVSEDGLVITNRHVGAGQLHTLSSARHSYEEDGFYAPTFQDEIPCQGLELMVLHDTENMTGRVKAAVKPGASSAEAEEQQRAVEAAIEKESFERTGLTSQVVALFGGARYDLYRYQKYPDVRLVFAPDRRMAFFGGDPDNFEFPRYDLDICFFRVYDHGKPLASRDYLKWNSAGPAKDELIFAAGHPGTSQRLVTMDELHYQRDTRLPLAVEELDRMERKLTSFSATSPEHAREAAEALASFANSRKAFHGFLRGLRDPSLLEAKADEEKSFRALLAQPDLPALPSKDREAALDAFARVKSSVEADRANYQAYETFERFGYRSDLFNLALTLVRAAKERAKPNGARLPAYRDSNLPSLEFRLFSGRPFYPDLETFFLTDALQNLIEKFGSADPRVKDIMGGESPEVRAEEWVRNTKLESIAYRRKLYADGQNAREYSQDPMLVLASGIDPSARAARKIDDDDEETRRRAYATIYQARIALGLAPKYPDATGTLRLAYGTVSGYDVSGKRVEPFTDFAGLFAHAAEQENKPPFEVTRPWNEARSKLDLALPLNFAGTLDILGGNSGSPVVDAKGEFVGIIFDGNEPSLAGRYVYDPAQNRSVAVDSAAILEALRKIYHAAPLATELEMGQAGWIDSKTEAVPSELLR